MTQMNAEHRYDLVLDSPLGRLGVQCPGKRVTRLDYVDATLPLKPPATRLACQVVTQLEQYFRNPVHLFSVPFDLQGTPFQCRVWEALTRIPAGEILTYGELAARLHTGARAVGNACRRNPVSIIVPCHRVVAATDIGGYSGRTAGRELDRKQWLLVHEGIAGPALKTRQQTPTSGLHTDKQRNLHA